MRQSRTWGIGATWRGWEWLGPVMQAWAILEASCNNWMDRARPAGVGGHGARQLLGSRSTYSRTGQAGQVTAAGWYVWGLG